MSTLSSFIRVVKNSRVLSQDQKQEILDQPELLPETYRKHVMKQLSLFDRHSRYRETMLRKKLEASFTSFEQQLTKEGIDETEKVRLTARARKQIKQFFPQAKVGV